MRWPTKIALGLLCAAAFPLLASAQQAAPDTPLQVEPDVFLRGTVTALETRPGGSVGTVYDATVRTDEGDVAVVVGGAFAADEGGIAIGDQVVLVRQVVEGEATYYLADRYRLPRVWALIGLLIAAAVVVGGKRGATATLGLAASVGILAFVVLPQVNAGIDPVLVTFLGGVAIAAVTTFLAHGVKRESGLVLAAILAALTAGLIAATVATWALQLNGLGSEEAVAITYGPLAAMDLRGLLIAGVLLGCLGVLDDVAATQVATVKEIAAADPRLTRRQLYRRGMRVGSEHVAALVNTLFLAYAGASLPLLIVGRVNMQLPVWAFLNTESVAEEIVRTAVGSGALILAVPIATGLAAAYFGARRGAPEK